jgi:trk system potassium uptake protein
VLLRPDADDLLLVLRPVARAVEAVGALMAVPLAVAAVRGEQADAWGFALGAGLAVGVGALGARLRPRLRLRASHALSAVGAAWLVVPAFAAVPLALSGHYEDVADAYAEAVSGLTANGLTWAVDVDHMPASVQTWRHLLQVVGAQAVLVVLLTAFSSGAARLGTLFDAADREDVILPNLRRAGRLAARVGVVAAVVGTVAATAALLASGLDPGAAPWHALALVSSAYSTSAFTLGSAGVAGYRSPAVEAVLLVLMVVGATSFVIHGRVLAGRPRELVQSTEARAVAASALVLFAVVAVGLARSGTFDALWPLHRHALFQLVSAHTTTGLSTLPSRVLQTDWGVLAPGALVTAMGLGGMTASMAGGVKGLRIAVLLKGLRVDIRTVLQPEGAVVVESAHRAGVRELLTPAEVRDAAVLLFLWLSLYVGGALVGLFHGHDLATSLLESTAASAGAGFTVGATGPGMAPLLQLVAVLQMVVGRVEFVALFALAGTALAVVRGRV